MKRLSKILILFLFVFSTSCHRAATYVASEPAQLGSRAQHEHFGEKYIVASEGQAASHAAKWAFDQGGNIFDAFAAASFAVSVERPFNTGLGGGGFALVHLKNQNETFALDFREEAPKKAWKRMFLDKKGTVIKDRSREGAFASGVPGMVRGVLDLHSKYGTLTREKVLKPAIDRAKNGVIVYDFMAQAIEVSKKKLQNFPESARIFLKPDGRPYEMGDRLIQKDLAKTLQAISEKGADGFYKGWVAKAIVSTQRDLGGLITAEDLAGYVAKVRKPVEGSYKGYRVLSMPPPSSGGIHVIQMLHFLEKDDLGKKGPYSPESLHLVLAAMKRAFADRSEFLGDSDFVDVPTYGLTSKDYAQSLRAQVQPNKALPSKKIKPAKPQSFEPNDTTHFTIMDEKGNVISSTQSINGLFGSGVVAKGTGVVLNNHMDDFAIKPGVPNLFGVTGGSANAVEAKKRPLSSMSPTIVFEKGRPILALGSPGGPRIITCVFQTILNYLEYDMDLFKAVSSVRYHHQWLPDEALVESPGLPKETEKRLKTMGYSLKDWPSSRACRVQAVAYEKNRLHGVSDPRRDGSVRSERTFGK